MATPLGTEGGIRVEHRIKSWEDSGLEGSNYENRQESLG